MWESETRAQKEAGLLQGLAALDIQLSLSCPLPNRRRVEALGPSAPLSELLVPAGSKGLERGSPATLTRFCTATLYRERLRADSALPGGELVTKNSQVGPHSGQQHSPGRRCEAEPDTVEREGDRTWGSWGPKEFWA